MFWDLFPWAAFLVFVGAKMMLVDLYKVPALASLPVIRGILTVAFVASFAKRRRDGDATLRGRSATTA